MLNGTTNQQAVDANVTIINPSAGMRSELTAEVVEGRFTIEGLDPGAYIARVDYKGTTYNQPFQIADTESVELSVTVYEPTTSWDGVHVTVPNFSAERHGNHLVIQRVYDIHNETDPPMTITGDDGFFRFPLPEDMQEFNGLFVRHSEVPVERQPVETDEAGVWLLDYPIRPGLTRVVMGYTVPYDSAAYTLREKARYDIEDFTIFATDPAMSIASPSHELAEGEGPHASVSWTIHRLEKGDELVLSFSGGSGQQQATRGDHPVVSVIPNNSEHLSMLVMVFLLLALTALVGVSLREPRLTGAQALRLNEYRSLLVQRLAKLDDLHETGAVPAAVYQTKRNELKNHIASISLRLDTGRASARKTAGRRRTGGKGRGAN